jgi:hypothetical protein
MNLRTNCRRGPSPLPLAGAVLVGVLLVLGSWGETAGFGLSRLNAGIGGPITLAVSWTPVAQSHGPTLGFGPMAFDAADGYVLLYEDSFYATSPGCAAPELWSFVHGVWSQLPSGSAPHFDTAVLAYDAAAKYVVLFGGCGTNSNETWTYAGGVWNNVTTSVAPPSREAASLVYDPATQAVVLFGGYVYFNLTAGAGYRANDTWEFQDGSWRNVTPALGPPVRDLFGMAPDSSDGYVVLFGGVGCCPTLGDTWTFSGGAWHNVTTGIHPSPRASSAFSDDPAAGGSILFGGQGGGLGGSAAFGPLLNDTWRFSGGSWQNLTIGSNPPARASADLVYDPLDGYLVLFGGEARTTPLNDTWVVNASLSGASSTPSGPNTTTWFYAGLAVTGVAALAIGVFLSVRKRTPKPPSERSPPWITFSQ